MFNKNVLSLSPTKYKFNIFFFFLFCSTPTSPDNNRPRKIIIILLFFISQGSNFQSSMTTPTIFKNIYTLHLFLPSPFSSSLLLPFTSHFQSSLQFAPNFFFLFPSIYVCNNTSRVKAVDPIVSFSKLFLSFSLSQFTLQYWPKFIF